MHSIVQAMLYGFKLGALEARRFRCVSPWCLKVVLHHGMKCFERGVHKNKANVATARELACWAWAIGLMAETA